jgi:hypothetical protein
VDGIAALLVNSGVDVNASLPVTPRFTPAVFAANTLQMTCTAADLAFSALVMQAKPCASLSPEFSLYRELISRLGLHLDHGKLARLPLCIAESLRYRSTCLDLMLSPHQLDICEC